jgi:integrase
MATIVRRPGKNGQTSYRAQVRRKGAQPLSATFTKLSDAKQWGQITEAAILEGRHFTTAEAKRHMLTDLVERYLVEVMPQTRPSTSYTQTRHLYWWRAQLGPHALAAITPVTIAECRNQLAQNHAPATVVRYLSTLSHAYTIAVEEWQWITGNPVRKVRKPKEPRGRVRFLSDDERQRLLATCERSRNPYLYTLVILALATGARYGELMHLHWFDVDLGRGTLTFRDTKNGETCTVPLTGYAHVHLQQHAKVRRLDTTLVFPDTTGKRPHYMRDAWKHAVQKATIPNFRFHDLRHTFASYMAMNGASLLEIAEVLGHKTLSMVKRYAHLTEGHTSCVVERMNRAVFGEP